MKNKSEIRHKTYRQLRRLSAEAGIVGRSRMNKSQLAAALSRHREARPTRAGRRRAHAPYQQLTHLPESYGATRLTLLEIDPNQLHAFWEVTPGDRKIALKQLDQEEAPVIWLLRFYEAPQRGLKAKTLSDCFDVTIDLDARNWYITVPMSGRSYYAELGPRSSKGRFEPICISNTVQLPRPDASPLYEPLWSKAAVRPESARRKPAPAPATEISIRILSPQSRSMPSEAPAAHSSVLPATVDRPENPPAQPSPARDTDIRSEVRWLSQPQPAAVSLSSLSVGAREEEHPGQALAGSGESLFSAELVVSGHTDPGQTLCVNGHSVKVNPDGTFLLHWAFPVRSG